MRWKRVYDEARRILIEALFANETPDARTLIQNQTEHWEITLVEQLLTTRLARLKSRVTVPKMTFTADEYYEWIIEETDEIRSLGSKMEKFLNRELYAAIQGDPADPLKIYHAIDWFYRQCKFLLDFEVKMKTTNSERRFREIKKAYDGVGAAGIRVFSDFSKQWSKAASQIRRGSTTVSITVKADFANRRAVAEALSKLENRHW